MADGHENNLEEIQTPLGAMKRPGRVLIVKPSSLGDVVTAMPVLRGLRRTFPQAHIAWLVSNACAPLIQGDSDLNETIIFERKKLGAAWRSLASLRALKALTAALRRGRFDWAIDLQGLFRSAYFTAATRAPLRAGFADAREGASRFYTHRVAVSAAHTVDRNIELARQLGVDARPEDFSLQVSPSAASQAAELCQNHDLPEKGFILCVPPTRGAVKQYPLRHWREVVAALSRRMPVALGGSAGAGEMELCRAVAEGQDGRVVNLAGQTDIPRLVALVARSRLVVCNDSAVKFIAPAVGVDVVTLIGPTRVDMTGPYLRGQAVVAEVPCQGCLKRRCRHAACMEMILPSRVVQAVLSRLG
ncbi:MAG: glycosyltransferase family 9 protein [Phycisphaerae bacterium]